MGKGNKSIHGVNRKAGISQYMLSMGKGDKSKHALSGKGDKSIHAVNGKGG